MPLEAELLASKAGGQLLRRLQFSHWRQHRDSWARQHENARNTRLAFAELLSDEPRAKPAAAAVKPAAAAAAARASAAATSAPAAAAEAPPARARPARQTRDSGAEAAVVEAPLGREEEEELDNLFDAPPARSKPKQQRKPPPPPPPPPSAAAAAAAAAAARLRPAGKASAPAGLQPLERPAKPVKSHKGAGQGAARGFSGAADGAPKKRRKGSKGEAEAGSEKPSRAERLASAFAVGQTAGGKAGKRKFAMT